MVRHQRRCGFGRFLVAALCCAQAAVLGCARNGDDAVDDAVDAGGDAASDSANAGSAIDLADVDLADAGPGLDAPAVPLSFMDYWRQRQLLEAQRRETCFKFPAGMAADGARSTDGAAARLESLHQGRLHFAAGPAQDCLAALAVLPCAELLLHFGEAEPELPACAAVLEPRVAEGAACAIDLDCQDGGQLGCAEVVSASPGEAAGCGRRCAVRLAPGADCAAGGVCAIGEYCRTVRALGSAPGFRCAPLPKAGEPCDPRCGPGLFCARASQDGWEDTDHGSCRPRVSGGACQNDWQCPWPLFCARSAGAAAGICAAPPTKLGESCVAGGDGCPLGSSCRATPGGGFACRSWPGPGAACGYLAEGGPAPEYTGCTAGFCDFSRGRGRGVCLELGAEGSACQDSKACRPGLICAAGPQARTTTCQTVAATAGQTGAACDFWNRCRTGLRCLAGVCATPPAGAPVCADPGAALDVIGGLPGLAATGTFRQVLVHGPASRQATALGRRIATLEPWHGRLYIGYGDYGANTGPIVISSWDPASNTVVEDLTFATEAVALYRPINGALYAPAIDPRGAGLTVYARGADSVAGGAVAPWTSVEPFGVAHAFDMASLDGQDLWVVGAAGSDAVAWRSLDGGAHWTEASRESSGPGLFSRYYFAAVLAGKLYVQASPAESGQSRVFDGTSWAVGPNLLPQGGQGWNPRRFGSELIYATWEPLGAQGSTLLAFDGAQVRPVFPLDVLDFVVDSDSVTVLGTDQRLRRSQDLVHWRVLGLAPEGARSLALLAGRLYVGATEGRLFVLEGAP